MGPTQSVLIRGVSLLQGQFCMHEICLGQHMVPALEWMCVLQGCPYIVRRGTTVYDCSAYQITALLLEMFNLLIGEARMTTVIRVWSQLVAIKGSLSSF